MHIGFLDSGVGGATVLAEALRRMPEERYLYFADTQHVPYGEKSKEAVRGFIMQGVERMMEEGLKALVIACNTATSIAAAELRQRYPFPIIGMEPAVKPAVLRNEERRKRVLVCATALTLRETKFKELVSAVDRRHIVDSLALPGLVDLAERGLFDGEETQGYLAYALKDLDLTQYGTVVLGCTHFPLFRPVFGRLLPPETDLIDGAEGTVRHLRHVLERNGLTAPAGEAGIRFLSSGDTEADRRVFELALGQARG